MGLGNDDVAVVDESIDDGGGGIGGKGFGSVSCSICLDVVADNGDRSWAKLQCGHQFHLGESEFEFLEYFLNGLVYLGFRNMKFLFGFEVVEIWV